MQPALTVTCTDLHTGGEPFRIVTGGVPPLRGSTVLERRADAAERFDHVRRLCIDEPRGHADMYGCFVCEPDDDGADLGVVFFHNEGYSTACGHGTIALVTWALDTGYLARDGEAIEVVVDVPSGRLACLARREGGRVRSVRFANVPSFVLARDLPVRTAYGDAVLDVAYGGAFYGSLDVRTLGLAVDRASLPALIALQRELRPALEGLARCVHPLEPRLAGIYGVVFWQSEPDDAGRRCQRNVTVFADGEVDRSPCGSGTSARLALLHARGDLAAGETLVHRSIVDSVFLGAVAAETEVAGLPAVMTEVEGSAHLCGHHVLVLQDDDPLGTGFLLR